MEEISFAHLMAILYSPWEELYREDHRDTMDEQESQLWAQIDEVRARNRSKDRHNEENELEPGDEGYLEEEEYTEEQDRLTTKAQNYYMTTYFQTSDPVLRERAKEFANVRMYL